MTDKIANQEIKDHSSKSGSKSRYIILLMILTGILMAVVDGSVVSIALPTITGYFNVRVADSEWVMTSYLVTLTSLLLIFGKVAERTGKARLFGMGIILFTLSSLACGLSSSLSQLILFRVVQSAGAAMMFSISAAMIFQTFPHGEQGRAMGYIGSTVAIGSIIGPSLGGFIVEILGWQYIFLINVPIGLVLIALSARYLRVEERRSKSLQMDWPGAATLILFLVSLMGFLGELASSLTIQPATVGLAAICIISLLAFVAIERRQKAPLLDLSIFGYPRFVLPAIGMIIFFISNMMVSILGPFYFEGVMGYSPSEVGLIYLIVPAIMVIGSPFTGWLYDKHHNRYYAALGMALLALSLMLMGWMAGMPNPSPGILLLTFVPVGIGCAFFQSPNNTEIMRALPREKMNTASSFTATVRNLGMALGVSLSGVLISLQLAQAGYYGAVLDAGPSLLSTSISRIMILAGALCVTGTVVSIIRGTDQRMA